LAPDPFWATDTTFFAVPRRGVDVYCLYSVLTRLDLARHNEASGVPSLSRSTLEQIRLLLPSATEQLRISEVMNICDEEVSTFESRLAALQAQKKGLMQRLLTGEVRVSV